MVHQYLRYASHIATQLVVAVILGVFTLALLFIPPYIVSYGIETLLLGRQWGEFWPTPDHPLSFIMATVVIFLIYAVVSVQFINMYRDKKIDAASLVDFPKKLVYLFIGLAVATANILLLFLPLEPWLNIYKGSEQPTVQQVVWMVIDNACRGMLLDFFEVFNISFSPIEINPYNVVAGLYFVFFRFVSAALLFSFVALEIKSLNNPRWEEEFAERQGLQGDQQHS